MSWTKVETNQTGQRRSLVEQFYHAVDWTSWRDVRKILRVYEQVLSELIANGGSSDSLTTLLWRDGFIYEERELRSVAPGANLKNIEDASEIIDRTVLHDHIRRIEGSIDSDPAQAIGSAKELVETTVKLILHNFGDDPAQYDSLQQLVKHAMKRLDLSHEDIPEAKRGAESIRKVLGALGQIVSATAELRNLYGTGHGRPRAGGLQPRHARLVVGAATTLTTFLLETLDARRAIAQ